MLPLVIIFASIGTLKKFHTNVEVINHGKEKQDAKDTAVEQAERSAFPELASSFVPLK